VVAAETFEFVGEIERRQDSEVDRIDRLAASADVPDFFVNCRSESFRPFVADITRDDQVLPHDLDVDAFHKSAEVETVKTGENFLDPRFDFAALGLMFLELRRNFIETLFALGQPPREHLIFTLQLLDTVDRSLYTLVQFREDVDCHSH